MASKIDRNKTIKAAQKYVQKGNYGRATREYIKIVEQDPRDVRIWLKIGDLYAKSKDVEKAVDTYLKVAEYYSEQGFYLKAVAVYKQILKLDTNQVDVNLRLAELYKQLGLLNDARQQYELVSNHYHQAGHTKSALEAVRQMVDLDPENVASRVKLAELYSKENMKEQAIEEFAKAADYLRAIDRLDDFVKVAERLVYHQPDNVPITKELASLYLRDSDPRRALQKLQLAFKSDPRDEETLGMLAQAFENVGQVGKAVSVLKELANIHKENGQATKYQDTLQRIIVLAPDDPDTQSALSKTSPPPIPKRQRKQSQVIQENAIDAPIDLGQPEPKSYSVSVPKEKPPVPVISEEKLPAPLIPEKKRPLPLIPEYEQFSPPVPVDVPFEPLSSEEDYSEQQAQPARVFDAPLAKAPETFEPHETSDFSEEVARVLTEVEVYIKYGLHEKALAHLKKAEVRAPGDLELLLKLKETYLQLGQLDAASEKLVSVAQKLMSTDRRSAAQYLNEALELAPNNESARDMLADLEGSAPSAKYELEEEIATDPSWDPQTSPNSGETAISIEEEIANHSRNLLSSTDEDAAFPEYDVDVPMSGEIATTDAIEDDLIPIVPQDEITDTLGTVRPPTGQITPSVELAKRAMPSTGLHEEETFALEDELEEADFFIQQSLFGEARNILEDLNKKYPNHPLVQTKLAELEPPTKISKDQVADDFSEQGYEASSISLAADLEEVLTEQPVDTAISANLSVEDVFQEFKHSTGTQVADEDSDTHYDLGIAYREMGLLDDAIAEFNKAMRSADKRVLCHMMIGLCCTEKQLFSDAISEFKKGLYVEDISERETIALYFELGQAYEKLDDLREALYYFEKVGKKDPQFRNVSERIKEIRQTGVGTKNGKSENGENDDSPKKQQRSSLPNSS
ncbi:MAG: tetratricopeptide repeat protein [Pseudomonadota bacterium]